MTLRVLGTLASAFIVISMAFKTTNFRGTLLMRIINALGSAFFIAYGFWPSSGSYLNVHAFATGFTNSVLFVLNIAYLIKETIDYKHMQIKENNK